MVEKDSDIPKISLSNTKKEMLEAFNKLKAKYQEQAKVQLKPEKVKAEKKEKEIVEVAEKAASEDVIARVNSLKVQIGTELTDLAIKLEQEKETYQKVKAAIEAKKKELQEVFEIEKSAFALAALIEAQKEKKLEFEAEMKERKKRLEEEISSTRAQWEKEKKEYLERLKEQKADDEKQRKREKEEYAYQFEREKQQETQALNDEIERLQKELSSKREAFEKERLEKENEFDRREQAVAEREKLMDDLQHRVEDFPQELEAKVHQAVKEVSERLKAEAKKNEELLLKGFEGEKNVLATQIASLEKLTAFQDKQIETLSKQLENAYGKVQDIAVKAVGSAQAANILPSRSKAGPPEPENT